MEFFRLWTDGVRDSENDDCRNFMTLEQAKSQVTPRDGQEWVDHGDVWRLENTTTGRWYDPTITRETIEPEE